MPYSLYTGLSPVTVNLYNNQPYSVILYIQKKQKPASTSGAGSSFIFSPVKRLVKTPGCYNPVNNLS